ncbi:MAG: DUF885 family protein [Acidobacteriota bacterium]
MRDMIAVLLFVFLAASPAMPTDTPPTLDELAARAAAIRIEFHSAEEYAAAADAWRSIEDDLARIDPAELGHADAIDHRLLDDHARIRRLEIEEFRLHEVVPLRYFALWQTDGLLLRPCSAGGAAIGRAIDELERLPTILANAETNLTRPARVWTENALYTAWYADKLLSEELPAACLGDPSRRDELLAATIPARQALDRFVVFLEEDLLPRSDRAPTWPPEAIEHYQLIQEQLPTELGTVDNMLRIASEEEVRLMEEMHALAKRIHPSGDLSIVWENMKNEAPPWSEVMPMAQWYVDHTARWLEHEGQHLIGIPERFDYGVAITTPMGRRILSFGGATYGPTIADRISGYYVLTPLEERLTEAEKASRIKAYNPYWTHVISYHEWVGHNVQRAWAQQAPDRPIRRLARSAYLSQSWSFYLERLFEEHGYFDSLPHLEALKTRMARLQMRMWRVQRILTKLRMAKGEMTFDQAVQAYVDKIGMEPTNAYIEVQRDSQTPASPGREIIGEMVVESMRDAYLRRFGEHGTLRGFHEDLLRQGELPLPAIQRILLGD